MKYTERTSDIMVILASIIGITIINIAPFDQTQTYLIDSNDVYTYTVPQHTHITYSTKIALQQNLFRNNEYLHFNIDIRIMIIFSFKT